METKNFLNGKTGVFGLKNIFCGLIIFGLILGLSGGVSANGCGCQGANYYFPCGGAAINESCNLTCNIAYSGTCFTVGANNIIIDCKGFLINGTGYGTGIYSPGYSTVTIKNCDVRWFETGIHFENSKDNTISDNNLMYNGLVEADDSGIHFDNVNNSIINGNNASSNDVGIVLSSSNNNTLTANIAYNNSGMGFLFDSSSGNTLTNNTAYNNGRDGIQINDGFYNTLISNTVNSNDEVGIEIGASSNSILTGNTANSNGIYGISIGSNDMLTGNTADSNNEIGIRLVSSSNNTLINNTASSNNYGIYLDSSSDNSLINNTVTDNGEGIYVSASSGNTIDNNNVSSNDCSGIYIESQVPASYNNITNNMVFGNGIVGGECYRCGITFSEEDNSNIVNNTVNENYNGICLDNSFDNALTDNTVNSNDYSGIYLYYSSNNNIINNTANSNDLTGILLTSSSNNNNLINNTVTNNGCSNGETYHISQLINGAWQEIYLQPFETRYTTKEFKINKTADSIKLRIIQKDTEFADIEQIRLSACGADLTPEYAVYTENSQSILEDILKIDNNVAIAHEKEIEASWSLPESCGGQATLYLTANEYIAGTPFRSPPRGYFNYTMQNSEYNSIIADGVINETDGISSPQYSLFWRPTSGHPEGYTYVYLRDDQQNVYVSLDVTGDNTNEFGEDWSEIKIMTQTGEKTFRIDDFNDLYGKCAFGMTSRVSYKHQTCEFLIPKSEIGKGILSFALRYYGTGSSTTAGIELDYNSNGNVITGNKVTDNCGYGLLMGYYGQVSNSTINSNTICSNTVTDIDASGSLNTAGDNNTCQTYDNYNDSSASSGGCRYHCFFNCEDIEGIFSCTNETNATLPVDMVLLLDSSGSMGYGSYPYPMDKLKNASKDLIDMLRVDVDRMAVVEFGMGMNNQNYVNVTGYRGGSVMVSGYDYKNIFTGIGRLKVVKVSASDYYRPGDNASYTVYVYNDGNVPAADVTVTDVLPEGWAYVEGNPYYNNCGGVTRNGNVFSIGTLDSWDYCYFRYKVKIPDDEETGIYVNKVNISGYANGLQIGGWHWTDMINVTNVTSGTGDIEIYKWAYDYWVKPGDSTTYEICVYNYGGVSGNVSMNDTLPDGWTFSGNPYDVYGDCTTITRNENTFILGTLPSDEYCCFYYDVNVPEDETAGERCNYAVIYGNYSDGEYFTDYDDDCVEVIADAYLEIHKYADIYQATPGQNVTYTVTVSNVGSGTAQDIYVMDFLPEEWQYVGSPIGSNCQVNRTGSTFYISGTLDEDAYCEFSYKVQIPANESAGSYCNSVYVYGKDTDGNSLDSNGGESGYDCIYIASGVTGYSISVDKTSSLGYAILGAGTNVTFYMNVTNLIDENITNVTVTDRMPFGFMNTSPTTIFIGTLAPHRSIIVEVNATIINAPESSFGSIPSLNQISLVHGFSSDRNSLKNSIDFLVASGETPMGEGIFRVNNLFGKDGNTSSKWVVVLISDGAPNSESLSYLAASDAKDMGVTIYTIGFGISTGSNGERVLQKIANLTGGKYYYSPQNASALSEIFGQIYTEVTSTQDIMLNVSVSNSVSAGNPFKVSISASSCSGISIPSEGIPADELEITAYLKNASGSVVKIVNVTYNPAAGKYEADISTLNLAGGSYTLTVEAKLCNHTGNYSKSITIEAQAPVQPTYPSGGGSTTPAIAEGCGDGLCGAKENYTTCPKDCSKPIVCGDGVCGGSETYLTCPSDCKKPPECTADSNCSEGKVCKDGKCVEKPAECTKDGDCTGGKVCKDGKCVEKPPECTKDSDCTGGKVCKDEKCVEKPIVCGDGNCEGDEKCESCPSDCGACRIPKLVISCTENAVVGDTVTCRVTDEGRSSVSGAAVTISGGKTFTTDDNGNIQFTAEESGKIDASAVKTGYVESEKAQISVIGGTRWSMLILALILILILILLFFRRRKKKTDEGTNKGTDKGTAEGK